MKNIWFQVRVVLAVIADYLVGKRTIITGIVLVVFNALPQLGVKLPFDQPTEATINVVLGALIMLFRHLAAKNATADIKEAAKTGVVLK